jgi:hypothetical protein
MRFDHLVIIFSEKGEGRGKVEGNWLELANTSKGINVVVNGTRRGGAAKAGVTFASRDERGGGGQCGKRRAERSE